MCHWLSDDHHAGVSCQIEVGPGYQVPFAARVRRDAAIATGAVGLITEPHQAEEILQSGHADLIIVARQFLRDPYWPRHAARELRVEFPWPDPYKRCDVGPLGR